MTFVLFQGSYNSHEHLEKWWLPKFLENVAPLGHKILMPQLPVDDYDEVTAAGPQTTTKQNLEAWLAAFENFYPQIDNEKELVFVSHSLGPLFVLHVLEKYSISLDAAIFVCPFLEKLQKSDWQINLVNSTFYKTDFDFAKLRKLVPISYVLYGTNDPYVENSQSLSFAEKMGSSLVQVVGGGHLSKEKNVDLIVEMAKTRINL